MKIVSTGKTISTTEYYEKKLKARRKKFLISLSAFIIFIIASVLVLRLEKLRIAAITVTGANVIGTDKVRAKAEEALSGYSFWLIPRNSTLLYSENYIRSELSRIFPRFSSVALSLEGFKTLEIKVVEREPFALYCADISLPSSCYFLDDGGFIFDQAPTFSEGVYFVYSSAEGLEIPLGRELLPASEFKALAEFIAKLKDLSLEPLWLRLSADNARLKLSSGAEIIWSTESNLERLYSSLESFLTTDEIKEEQDFWHKLSELDLRTEDKVFYTFK